MSSTVVTNTTTSYAKVIDTAITSFTIQNIGVRDIYVIFTTGAAPSNSAAGLRIKPNHGVDRNHGDGHVYIRSVNEPSVIATVQ